MSQASGGRLVQVSFVGAPQKDKSNPQFPYQRVIYQFQDTVSPAADVYEVETALFPLALAQCLEHQGRRANSLLILGTSGSNWHAVAEPVLTRESPSPEVLEWGRDVAAKADAPDGGSVTQHDLDKVPSPVADGLPVDTLTLRVIPNSANTQEQRLLMSAIIEHLQPGDRVVLDVTHAFRHLPVLAAFLLCALRWLNNVIVEDIYYGALDMRPRDEPRKPVINLRIGAEYADMGAAMAVFETTGSYRALAEHFETDREGMQKVDFLEGIQRLEAAKADAKALHKAFSSPLESDPYLSAAADRLRDEWSWAVDDTPERYMLAQAQRLLRHGAYSSCALVLRECFSVFFERHAPDSARPLEVEQSKEKKDDAFRKATTEYKASQKWFCDLLSSHPCLSKADKKKMLASFEKSVRLRNYIVHARPNGAENLDEWLLSALNDREAMEDVLRGGMDLMRCLLERHQEQDVDSGTNTA